MAVRHHSLFSPSQRKDFSEGRRRQKRREIHHELNNKARDWGRELRGRELRGREKEPATSQESRKRPV